MFQAGQASEKKLNLKNNIQLTVYILLIVLLITSIAGIVSIGGKTGLLYFKLCSAFEVVLLICLAGFILFLSRINKKEVLATAQEKEAALKDVQREAENQAKIINNLSSLYNEAVEFDKIKTEFFSNMYHELKTPLAVILGAIQLINQKMSAVSDERRRPNKHLKTIKQNCYRLLRLINNILDITRIDSGYVKMNPVNCNIIYLIEEITQSVAPYAEQKGILLEFDTEEEEIVTAVDIDKIERIVLNLLSNAIKFTPSGGKVSVGISKSQNKVRISVKDSGTGIPVEMQSLIFERFRQADNALTRVSEGSGIGLSIVKSFVELHEGTISLASEEGKGSEFIIELPVKLCEASITTESNENNYKDKIVEAINIEFSDIYSTAS